jgi:tetratricopeptide (TPR) repeat protein
LLAGVLVLVGAAGLLIVSRRPASLASASLERARSQARARRFDRAEAELNRLLAAQPGLAEAHLLMAELATRETDARPELALEHLAQIRPKDDRQAALVRFFQGKAEYQRGRYDLAEARWRDALRLDPGVPEAGWTLMGLLEREGRYEEAHQLGFRLHENEPDPEDRVRLLLELARLDVDRVDPGSQVQLFESLAKAHPEHRPLTRTLGLALIRNSQPEPGLAILQEALRADGGSPEAWLAWLTGLAEAHEPIRLAEEVDRLPASLAADPRFAEFRGQAAQGRRDWPAAIAAYRLAHTAEPYNLAVAHRLRQVLRLAGKTDEARELDAFCAAFQEASKRMRAEYTDALALEGLGQRPYPERYQRLAELREEMGRYDEAAAWHRLVLRDLPNDSLSLEALKRLETRRLAQADANRPEDRQNHD